MHIVSAGVDASDGYTTQAVRRYCRVRAPRVFALKGASTRGKPVIGMPTKQDLTWKGEKISNGVEMWPIGTDTAKSTLYGRFKVTDQGPGRIHTYIGLDDEYYQQLTAEKLITRFVKGYPVREWHNVRGTKRNEALDTFVYAYAAAIRAGLPYLDLRASANGKTVQPKKRRRIISEGVK
jgi:terminase, large subunit